MICLITDTSDLFLITDTSCVLINDTGDLFLVSNTNEFFVSEMLRANVYITIANRNFTDEMLNRTSLDFESISQPLCAEVK